MSKRADSLNRCPQVIVSKTVIPQQYATQGLVCALLGTGLMPLKIFFS